MSVYSLVNQIEIRFTPILDFAEVSKSLMAPYIQLTDRFNLENENTFKQKIDLYFDSLNYGISLYNDRIFLRTTTTEISKLTENNSIITEPFLSIFEKLAKSVSFGKINNTLYHLVALNHNKEYDLDKFKTAFFSPSLPTLFNTIDCSITLESNKTDDEQFNLSFGPYLGENDLLRRNINLSTINNKEILEAGGVIADLNIVGLSPIFNLKTYREKAKTAENIIRTLWAKI